MGGAEAGKSSCHERAVADAGGGAPLHEGGGVAAEGGAGRARGGAGEGERSPQQLRVEAVLPGD